MKVKKKKSKLTRADKPHGSFRFRLFCFEVKAKICKPVWLLIITNFMGQAECSILKLNRWFYILYLLLGTKTLRHIFLLNKFVWFSGVLEILESVNIRRKLKALKIGVKNRYGSLKENKRSFAVCTETIAFNRLLFLIWGLFELVLLQGQGIVILLKCVKAIEVPRSALTDLPWMIWNHPGEPNGNWCKRCLKFCETFLWSPCIM